MLSQEFKNGSVSNQITLKASGILNLKTLYDEGLSIIMGNVIVRTGYLNFILVE